MPAATGRTVASRRPAVSSAAEMNPLCPMKILPTEAGEMRTNNRLSGKRLQVAHTVHTNSARDPMIHTR